MGSYRHSPPSSVPACTEMGFAVIWALLLSSAAPGRTGERTSPSPHPPAQLPKLPALLPTLGLGYTLCAPGLGQALNIKAANSWVKGLGVMD